MELKYKIVPVIRVNYIDLGQFLTERFDLPEKYEFVAIEELGNDVVKSIRVSTGKIGEFDQADIDAILVDKQPELYSTGTILCYLCNLGEIPEGEYLIDVSW